jgi:PAS domain S-box-containing protein
VLKQCHITLHFVFTVFAIGTELSSNSLNYIEPVSIWHITCLLISNNLLKNSVQVLMLLKSQKLQTPDINIAKDNNMKKTHYFIKFAVPIALCYWFLDSVIHYFVYNESAFEIIPSDGNDLWMRISIFILLISFGLFADITSRKIIERNKIINKAENISRAKKQWQLIIDSLPQLVIAMDENARITRTNRTIETWEMGKVNKVDGLYVSDFLNHLNDNHADDAWTSDWPYIWQQIKKSDSIVRKIEKKHMGKTYLYTLRKIPDYDSNNDQCYAVLVIDDITTRQDVENSLKDHALQLEKEVSERTLELKQANQQLEQELQLQKIARQELKKSEQCRLSLLRESFSDQEKERKRIACELHDSIGQSLGAAKFKIEELLLNRRNFNDDNEHEQFSKLVDTIKNTIHEVRHIAMDLRPAMLDDLGTLPTLKWFCREFENTYTKIKVDLLLHIDETDIPENRKVVIFRIVQEAMNNIVKHSDATKIVLELSRSSADMRLCVSDNGCGFTNASPVNDKNSNKLCEPSEPRCSFGLNSMHERAESTHGKFEIETTPGSGTSIIVTWGNLDAPT